MQAVERTREFRGRYHVLGGALDPLSGVGPEQLRIRELLNRIGERVDGVDITEVIIATDPNTEGEATATYLVRMLRDIPGSDGDADRVGSADGRRPGVRRRVDPRPRAVRPPRDGLITFRPNQHLGAKVRVDLANTSISARCRTLRRRCGHGGGISWQGSAGRWAETPRAAAVVSTDVPRRLHPEAGNAVAARQDGRGVADVGPKGGHRRRGGVGVTRCGWVDDDEPVEILVDERRRQSGLIIRMDRLADDEVTTVADLPVTTTARTAFDLGAVSETVRCDRPVGRVDAGRAVFHR